MTPDEYLREILAQQTFENEAPELKEVRKRRKEIEKLLREHFAESAPSIRWAGSMAKNTMICESYDGDMTCYFRNDDNAGGANLREIYENTEKALQKNYVVERKASALRVKDPSTKPTKGFAQDLHIDVVPGRFTDEHEEDVFLHRTTGEKERLKTNLQVHIDHIRDSGVTDAIRLLKLWRAQNGLSAKTFVLELLVVKLVKPKKSSSLPKQLEHVWTEFRDNAGGLCVEDPANPGGNDLKPMLDACRNELSTAARNTLWQIENKGWEAVFGPVENEEKDADEKKASLSAAAIHVSRPTKPWCRDA